MDSPADNKKILNRLRRVEGQIAALRKMIEEERACEDLVTQFLAAKSAIESAFAEVMENNLAQCLHNHDDKRMKHLIKLLAKK